MTSKTEQDVHDTTVIPEMSNDAREALIRGGGARPWIARELMNLGLLKDDRGLGWCPPHTLTSLGEQVRKALSHAG